MPVKEVVGVNIAPSNALLILAIVALASLVIPISAEPSLEIVIPNPESSRSRVPLVTVIVTPWVSPSESATDDAIELESVNADPSHTA